MMSKSVIPNILTVGNLFCGFLAIRYIVEGNFIPAAWLIVLGATLDKMDGKLARYMGEDSLFGIEFDSLVDVCTFGMAPALMIYYTHLHSGWGLTLAFIYLLCGALRLARFNTMSLTEVEKGAFFMGLPIPIAAVVLTQYVVFTENTWDSTHVVPMSAFMVVFMAFLMVSRLAYDTMPNFRSTGFWDRFKQLYFLTSIGLVIYDAPTFFFPLTMLYISSGLYRWVTGSLGNAVTQRA